MLVKDMRDRLLDEYALRNMRLADECQVLREKLIETMGTVAFQKWETDRGR